MTIEKALAEIAAYIHPVDEEIFDALYFVRAEIKRKDEAVIKAKLLIEKYNRWTGQAMVQGHVPDHAAKITVAWLNRALQNKEEL